MIIINIFKFDENMEKKYDFFQDVIEMKNGMPTGYLVKVYCAYFLVLHVYVD